MEVIRLFEEKGTVDEIGIGSVRDALSDGLFPGTSVLQTRARYFFFIPWIYLDLERRQIESERVAKEARRLEIGLIEPLLASEDNAGTIGRLARHRLRQLPSASYWSGLHAWGLKPSEQSQDQYHRSLNARYQLRDVAELDDDGQPLDSPLQRSWHAGLPKPPAGFPKGELSFGLTRNEAEYLHERIATRCKGTLLAHLVDACEPTDPVDFVWAHPAQRRFPTEVNRRLEHARCFSEAILGAALLYNLMLAEKGVEKAQTGREEQVEFYRGEFEAWTGLITGRRSALSAWDRDAFWALVLELNPRIPLPTRLFIDTWLRLALEGDLATLMQIPQARRLIRDRERAIKGRLARLENMEALARWRGASGAFQLDYRWNPNVYRIVTDIQVGLRS